MNTVTGHGVEALVPEGLERPPDIPSDVFQAALDAVLAGRRLDMGGLATAVGTSRATLYRRVSDRDHLLGEVVWYLVRFAVVDTLHATADLHGSERVVETARRFLEAITTPVPAFRRLLEEEPVAALRILTSRGGVVHPRLVDVTSGLLEAEESHGHLSLRMSAPRMAEAIIRLAQAYIYADAITGEPVDVDEVVALIGALLESQIDERS